MPTSRYVEFSLNANYFQSFISSVNNNASNPTYDHSLINHLNVPIEVMQKNNFQYNKSKMNIHKDKITLKTDMYEAVSTYLIDHSHPASPDNIASLYAVALSRYYCYQRWFTLLNHPLASEDGTELIIDFVTNNDVFEIHLTQKESKLGSYTERHFGSSTVFKARQDLSLSIATKQITSAKEISFSVSKQLWEGGLQTAANAYLNRLNATPFSSDDILVLTPFLLNQAFLTTYSQRYAKQSFETQTLVRNTIANCFSSDTKDQILMVLTPYTLDAPPLAPPIRPIASSDIPSRVIRDERSSNVNPAPFALTPEEDFTNTYAEFTQYVKFETYEASQAHYMQQLADAITNLTPKEREKNYSLLANVMRKTKRVVETPSDTDNLCECAALIEPLKKSNMHRVAFAVTAIVLGAIIIAASLAVTLASFGVTSVPAVFGISVGTGLLTKGIAIASSVVGLAVCAAGFRLFSHRPYKPVTDNVDHINKVALDYNDHQPRIAT
jgi:hypothetical protein